MMPHDSGPPRGPIPADPEELRSYGSNGHSPGAIVRHWAALGRRTTATTIRTLLAQRHQKLSEDDQRRRLEKLAAEQDNLAPLLDPKASALLQLQAEILRKIAASKTRIEHAQALVNQTRALINASSHITEEAATLREETGTLVERIREIRRATPPFKPGPLPDYK